MATVCKRLRCNEGSSLPVMAETAEGRSQSSTMLCFLQDAAIPVQPLVAFHGAQAAHICKGRQYCRLAVRRL